MSQKTNEKINLLLILIVSACLIPGYGSALGTMNMSTPLWSDNLGQYEVLVACSNNGSFSVAGSDTGILRMYDMTGKTLWTYLTNGTSITSVSISGDGKIISATTDGKILVFRQDGTLFWNYTTGAAVNRIAVSNNGETIVSSGDNTLYLFDSKGNLLGKDIQQGEIWNVTVSEDGNYSAAAVDLGWRERKGNIAITGRNGSGSLDYPTINQGVDVGVTGDGSSVVGVDDYTLYSVFRNGTPRWNFTSSPPFNGVAITPDGKYIVAGSQYYLRFFNNTGSLLWKNQESGYVNSVAISEDGNSIIAGSSDQIRLFDRSGRMLWQYDHGASHVSASKDGDYFVVGTPSEIQFFNRWGDTTLIEEPDSRMNSAISPNSTPSLAISPAPESMPVSDLIIVGALSCVGLFSVFRKRIARK